MAFSEVLRIGAGNVKVDAYGGAFSGSEFDTGKTDEGGISFEYSSELKKVASAQDITIDELFMTAEELMLKFALKSHKMENLAYSWGHPVSDVVDDAVSTPKKKTLTFGARRTFTPVALQLKILQPDSATLYDIITIFRGVFVGAFNQVFTIKNERYIHCEVHCLGDATNSGKMGKIVSEYA